MRMCVPVTVLATAALVAGATAAPAAAATELSKPKKAKDKVTVHWQTTKPHWGTFDQFSATTPTWAKKVAVQRLEGATWHTMYTDAVQDGKVKDYVVLLSSLNQTYRIKAIGTAGHKGVASKGVTLNASAPTALQSRTGDGPSTSAAFPVRDFVDVGVKWSCAGEPNGHAMALELVQDGTVVGNVTVAPTSTGMDENVLETDSFPTEVEVVGATDCHWELLVLG
ncbi:MAG TPA: hypothetical protein VHE83_02730 [Mycobacteriales bacterium]|nr:hypothetical protein [Mycobacteriales bacterium]